MNAKFSNRKLIYLLIGINLLWLFVFRSRVLNFWVRLTLTAIVQLVISLIYGKVKLEFKIGDLIKGIGLAVILYGVFWLGNKVSGVLFPWSREQINEVYNYRRELSGWLIGLLLVGVVGPGEEIFWRGFMQSVLEEKMTAKKSFLVTAVLYSGIHLWTGNIMLIVASLTAGLFWGYLKFTNKSLASIIISHSLWDVMVFILFPFGNL